MKHDSQWRVDLTAAVCPAPQQDGGGGGEATAAAAEEGWEDIVVQRLSGEEGAAVGQHMPRSLFQYCLSTLSSVFLSEADISGGVFSSDPFFSQRRPRSAVVTPIVRQQQAIAMLYLEDELQGAHALPAGHQAVLLSLCQQAALSIQNAWQTSALTQAKEAAEQANLAKSTFLSSMSHEIRCQQSTQRAHRRSGAQQPSSSSSPLLCSAAPCRACVSVLLADAS